MTGTVTPSPLDLTPSTLTHADRCDRCGAQARVRVVLGQGELLFCAHHAKAYESKLKDTAVQWVDETHVLAAEIST